MVLNFTGLYKENYEYTVFLEVWPQLAFTDSGIMEDLPSIMLEYDIGHDRHKIPVDGIHLVKWRGYLFFPHAPMVFTVHVLTSGAREGIGGSGRERSWSL